MIVVVGIFLGNLNFIIKEKNMNGDFCPVHLILELSLELSGIYTRYGDAT